MKSEINKLVRRLIEKVFEIRLDFKTVLPNGTRMAWGTRCRGKCSFGKYCAIGEDVKFIQDRDHDYNKLSLQFDIRRKMNLKPAKIKKGEIVVGNDVWIGDSAIILSGVSIGDGAVIGAGSVVTKDVEPYSISAGVPAKHIKWRFPKETRDFLLDLRWWDWSKEKILANKDLFELNWSDVDFDKIEIK